MEAMAPRYEPKFNKGDRVRQWLPQALQRSRMDIYAHQKVYLVINKAWGSISQEWRYTLMDYKGHIGKTIKEQHLEKYEEVVT